MKKLSAIALFLICIFSTNMASAVSISADPIPCNKFAQSLKYTDGFWNDKNEAIMELQQALFDGGYLIEAPDGSFGAATLRAVTSFQRKNDILATGYVGEKTRSVLKDQFCKVEVVEPIVTEVTNNCKVWNDGCNTCSRSEVGSEGACTMMACIYEEGVEQPKPSCKEYFPKIQQCPSEKIIDKMPVMCVTTPCNDIEKSYYILDGKRKEVADFDTEWLKNNCSVKETIAY